MPSLPDVHSHPWHGTDHHLERGFQTPWRSEADAVPPLRAAQWLLGRPFRRRDPGEPAPFQLLDPAVLARPVAGRARIAWLGHATLLLQTAGLTILTDPVFAERASPVGFAGPKREVPPPLALEALPRVDVVLLSHDHYDHLDRDALARIARRDRPLVLTPLGVRARLDGLRPQTLALDWGQYVEHRGVRFHCTPAKHFSGRGLTDRDVTLWASWTIESLAEGGAQLFWGGDTGYSPHFRQIRERYGAPDVVLLPIGAYEPRWFMRRVHVDPEEAVRAYLDLGGAETGAPFVPYHWGTFDLTDEPLDEPPRRLREHAAEAGVAEALRILPVGGVLEV
jgi:N-acyl-phosphatidylethanolamine-hydrolysing phospholipase D